MAAAGDRDLARRRQRAGRNAEILLHGTFGHSDLLTPD
jgi:hypothetical protein